MRSGAESGDIILHALELEGRCEYAPAVSSYLTPSEQAELWRRVRYPHRLFYWGGFIGAERRAAVFLPEWAIGSAPYGAESGQSGHISPERERYLRELIFGADAPFEELAEELMLISVVGSGHRRLDHRDILGSVMGLGITRSSIGDICMTSDSSAVLASVGKLTPYICGELTKVGSDGVRVKPLDSPESFTFERKTEEISVTVASMRLDGVISAVTGMSRSSSAELISSGLVRLSDSVQENPAAEVRVGMSVSVRGFGKFSVLSTDGFTRKSRIRLIIGRYV